MQEQSTKKANHSYTPFDVESEGLETDIESEKSPSQIGVSLLWNTIQLNPGISKLNFFCCVLFYCSMVFGFTAAHSLQPLILTDKDYYNISQDKTGGVLSLIMAVQLVVKVIVGIPYGHFADKFGRKNMIVLGSVCYLASFILVPLQTTILGLIVAKILLANGTSCLHAVPLMIDYISNESRGRASALLNMATSLSAIAASLSVRKLFQENFSIGSCYMIFGIGVSLVMILDVLGLKGGHYFSENLHSSTARENITSLKQNIRESVSLFKENGWLAIGLVLKIFGGSDIMVFFMFMSVFVKSMFPEDFDPKQANIIVTNFNIMVKLTSFFSNIFYGWFLDKKNKPITAGYIALIGGCFAFFLFSTSSRYDDWTLYLGAPLIGATLPGLFVIINFINMKHFPPEKRGVMMSVTGFAGHISHFLIASAGGLLYDHVSKSGPFRMCCVFLIISVLLVKYIHKTKVIY